MKPALLTSTLLTFFQPTLKRLGAFTAAASCQEALNANVFVQVWPLDSVPIAQKYPVLAFFGRRVVQARVPFEGYR